MRTVCVIKLQPMILCLFIISNLKLKFLAAKIVNNEQHVLQTRLPPAVNNQYYMYP